MLDAFRRNSGPGGLEWGPRGFEEKPGFTATDHRLARSSKLSHHKDREETLDDSGPDHRRPPRGEEAAGCPGWGWGAAPGGPRVPPPTTTPGGLPRSREGPRRRRGCSCSSLTKRIKEDPFGDTHFTSHFTSHFTKWTVSCRSKWTESRKLLLGTEKRPRMRQIGNTGLAVLLG